MAELQYIDPQQSRDLPNSVARPQARRNKYALLIGILILAGFLRFYHLTSLPPGLYPDEASYGNDAAYISHSLRLKVFYRDEGIFVNILAVLFRFHLLPTNKPWSVRFPSAAAGVLTVLGIYLFVAELFGDAPGLCAAFLLATAFWHIHLSRLGFLASFAALFLTFAAYFLSRAYKTTSRAAWYYAILAGITFSSGFYSYIIPVSPLILLIFVPFFKGTRGFWKRSSIFLTASFIIGLPIGRFFVRYPDAFFVRMRQISVTNDEHPTRTFASNLVKTALEFNFRGDQNWRQNISGAPQLFWPVGILFIIGLILAVRWIWAEWRKRQFDNFTVEDPLPLVSSSALRGSS